MAIIRNESSVARTQAAPTHATPGRYSRLRGGIVLIASAAIVAIQIASLPACTPTQPAATVSMKFKRAKNTPRDAAVYIDEQFVGLLGVVAARGVRLPAGEHRITIERDGYFPWDALVKSDGEAIKLDVQMRPIPD